MRNTQDVGNAQARSGRSSGCHVFSSRGFSRWVTVSAAKDRKGGRKENRTSSYSDVDSVRVTTSDSSRRGHCLFEVKDQQSRQFVTAARSPRAPHPTPP